MVSEVNFYSGSQASLERSQQVLVEGQSSASGPVTSGVLQGTVLSPLLFLIYINDLPSRISSTCCFFADDSRLYRIIRSPPHHPVTRRPSQATRGSGQATGMGKRLADGNQSHEVRGHTFHQEKETHSRKLHYPWSYIKNCKVW